VCVCVCVCVCLCMYVCYVYFNKDQSINQVLDSVHDDEKGKLTMYEIALNWLTSPLVRRSTLGEPS